MYEDLQLVTSGCIAWKIASWLSSPPQRRSIMWSVWKSQRDIQLGPRCRPSTRRNEALLTTNTTSTADNAAVDISTSRALACLCLCRSELAHHGFSPQTMGTVTTSRQRPTVDAVSLSQRRSLSCTVAGSYLLRFRKQA